MRGHNVDSDGTTYKALLVVIIFFLKNGYLLALDVCDLEAKDYKMC